MMKKNSQGFTLIELMIVVAIVGILAVLAVYGVRKYLQNAKTAEAKNSLGIIAKDSSVAWDKESMAGSVLALGTSSTSSHSLCAAGAAVPATYTAGQKYQSQASDWAAGGWPCLKFTMEEPQYYIYSYTSASPSSMTGASYTATANADLDANGVTSTFSITGSTNAGILNNAPNITITNEDE